ncbi:MAG: nucleotidyl transferase AbiEii/AbiGii toxin family protein [Campylobacteraceae bacterium]|nr:nucleotidyl transferase AbiEii/AbiGii toxin family protein [Campylobacteraceae bacterium]
MELTNIEKDHYLFMTSIVKSLADTPYVLKGGTALMFGYDLDRFSEDLDFDSIKKLNLETKIRESLPHGFEIIAITKPKDTDTVQRYKVHYKTLNGNRRLKIETSYRTKEIDINDYTLIKEMQIYNIDFLLDNKLLASHDGLSPRTTARDLYDIDFIVKNFSDVINDSFIRRLNEFTLDNSALLERFEDAYNEDLLVNSKVELDDLIIRLSKNIKQL